MKILDRLLIMKLSLIRKAAKAMKLPKPEEDAHALEERRQQQEVREQLKRLGLQLERQLAAKRRTDS